MDQREFSSTRPKTGEAEIRVGRSEAGLLKGPGGPLPTLERELPLLGSSIEPGEVVESRPSQGGRGASNADAERWSQAEGLEEQEFSIKEASFSEGSLKLKIQTTKRAKKPPKNLENYICPPEIRITIKQPGEQKTAKQCKVNKVGKEEGKGSKKMVNFGNFDQNSSSAQPDPTKSQAPVNSPQESGASTVPTGETTNRSEGILSDLANTPAKSQQTKITSKPSSGFCISGSSCPTIRPAIAQSPVSSLPQEGQTDGKKLTPVRRDKDLREVSEQLFGSIKKYERKDSTRNFCAYNSDPLRRKVVKDICEDGAKEKRAKEPEKPALPSGEVAEQCRRSTEKSITQPACAPLHTDEAKGLAGRKRQPVTNAPSNKDFRHEAPEPAEKRDKESKVTNKMESSTAKLVDNHKPEAKTAITEGFSTKTSGSEQRRKGTVRPQTINSSDGQGVTKPLKVKPRERLSCSKLKNSSCQNVPELPSVYPITPSSPLYSNTSSLTVIAPVKKNRGRPKKQPLLTVETIHEGSSESPVTLVNKTSPQILRRRWKKQSFGKLANAHDDSHQLSELKGNDAGEPKKSTSNKIRAVEMKTILNEIFSCQKSNPFLKSIAPMSNAVSTVASTIEARLGRQINISKRGTIYIGKKRGRKPKPEGQNQKDVDKGRNKQQYSCPFENPVVPSKPWPITHTPPRALQSTSAQSVGAPGSNCAPYLFGPETSAQDLKTMPSLQSVSGLIMKAPKSTNWKRSPPQLLANSPSHLSEMVSLKEVTLSPVSESHSEETIPSDSGIGTDNNSTSDQAEKGSGARRRYSFDFCCHAPSDIVVPDATKKSRRGHWHKRTAAVGIESLIGTENLKKQKHWRKRKGLHRRSDHKFLVELEELIAKFHFLRISHHRYSFYHENSYPNAYRIHYDQYYPVPCLPYDHLLRKNFNMRSKKRHGKPGKSNELITKTPFYHGFSYPIPSNNFYAPYTMPYTSMPIASTMMNLGYYGQYPPPLYISHTFGTKPLPFSRPVVTSSQLHSGPQVKLTAASKHKSRFGSHPLPITRMDNVQPLLMVPKGGNSSLPSVRLHKCKHKHKHKHNEGKLSSGHSDDIGELYRRAVKPTFLSLISENGATQSKQKDKQQNQQTMDTLQRRCRNIFEVDSHPRLSQFDSSQWKVPEDTGQSFQDIQGANKCRHEAVAMRQNFSSELFERMQSSRGFSAVGSRKRGLESDGVYMEPNTMLRNTQREKTHAFHRPPSPPLGVNCPTMEKRFKRKENEEIHCSMRNVCKILSTKKSLDHVNKILKAKRLQRQAKTGNNMVKRRRGRPRKRPLSDDEESARQMPVLEKCVDLHQPHEVFRQDFSNGTTEPAAPKGWPRVRSESLHPADRWQESRSEFRPKRVRWCPGSGKGAGLCTLSTSNLPVHFTP